MDLEEYLDYSKYKGPIDPEIRGMYCNGLIWVRKKNFVVIAHEFVHHILELINRIYRPNIRFFIFCCNTTFDFIHCFMQSKKWRKETRAIIPSLYIIWKEFFLNRNLYRFINQNI